MWMRIFLNSYNYHNYIKYNTWQIKLQVEKKSKKNRKKIEKKSKKNRKKIQKKSKENPKKIKTLIQLSIKISLYNLIFHFRYIGN